MNQPHTENLLFVVPFLNGKSLDVLASAIDINSSVPFKSREQPPSLYVPVEYPQALLSVNVLLPFESVVNAPFSNL